MTKSIKGTATVFLVAAILLISSFHVFDAAVATAPSTTPIVDGTIVDGEYPHLAAFSADSFHLYWQVEGDVVFFAMMARTSGYLGVGFDPDYLMKGADMVVGWVDANGTAIVHDAYSSGLFGPVVRDIDLGGTDDLIEQAGESYGGNMVIEFSRPLSTADAFDNEIPSEGELVVIWATGNVFDPESMPNDAGMEVINMASGDSTNVMKTYPFYLLGLSMALAVSLMSVLLLRGRGDRRRGHFVLGASAALSLFGTGLLVFAIDPYLASWRNSWTVAVPLALFAFTALLGLVALRPGEHRRLGTLHLLSGCAAIIGLAIVLALSLLS